MENDECRMQNGGQKVAISGVLIDAHGCGLNPAESGSERGKPSSDIIFHRWLMLFGLRVIQLSNSALNRPKASSWLWSKRLGRTVEMRYV